MNDRQAHLNASLDRIAKELAGDSVVAKHIMLLKLSTAMENLPDFGSNAPTEFDSVQRRWISEIGAVLKRQDINLKVRFETAIQFLDQYWVHSVRQICGLANDAIASLKLELELDGGQDIGTVYEAGNVYRYFADLKAIFNEAKKEIFIVDPYFDGNTFDAYFPDKIGTASARILAGQYSKELEPYVQKHIQQFGSSLGLRKSKETHDRLIVIDNSLVWITGGSIKDAGKKPTYLIPFTPALARAKICIYEDIWNKATVVV